MNIMHLTVASTHPTGPATLSVLVVPGNPGSALYYGRQLQELHAALGGTVDVLAVSHAGHSSDVPTQQVRCSAAKLSPAPQAKR